MVLEVAVLYVEQGQEDKFENDFKVAGQYISSVKGYLNHSLQKCIEQVNKYLLLVEWEKITDHIIGFRQSELMKTVGNSCIIIMIPFPLWNTLNLFLTTKLTIKNLPLIF